MPSALFQHMFQALLEEAQLYNPEKTVVKTNIFRAIAEALRYVYICPVSRRDRRDIYPLWPFIPLFYIYQMCGTLREKGESTGGIAVG